MEAQYKAVTRTVQLITKEVSQEEANEMLGTLTRLKEQLGKVAEYLFYYIFQTVELINSRDLYVNSHIYAFEQLHSTL